MVRARLAAFNRSTLSSQKLSLSPRDGSAPATRLQGVRLAGATPYKGLLLFAELNGAPAGSWATPGEGLQLHPSCKHHITHDVYHLSGRAEDSVSWVVPADYSAADSLVFKATVVQAYSTWYALEEDFKERPPGAVRAAAPEPTPTVTLVPGQHAPGEVVVPGQHAPGELPLRRAPGSERRAPGVQPAEEEAGGEATPRAPLPESATKETPRLDVDSGSAETDDEALMLASRRRAKMAHGVAMLSAWAFAAPVGALTARYGKGRGPVWFDVHRAAQVGALLLTLGGAAIAVVVLQPGVTLGTMGPHGRMGTAVLGAACFQAVAGAFRPPKTGGKRRILWERLHKGLGWGTLALALYNCWVGLQMMLRQEGSASAVTLFAWLTACGVGVFVCVFRFGSLVRLTAPLLRPAGRRPAGAKLSV